MSAPEETRHTPLLRDLRDSEHLLGQLAELGHGASEFVKFLAELGVPKQVANPGTAASVLFGLGIGGPLPWHVRSLRDPRRIETPSPPFPSPYGEATCGTEIDETGRGAEPVSRIFRPPL